MASCEALCDTSTDNQRGASASLQTNAVSRGLSDLHTPTWLALLTFNVTLRTVLFHPLQLAIARKRVTREDSPPSVSLLIRQAYNGDVGGARTTGGLRGVYRGLGAAVTGNIIGEVTYLHTMERVREALEDNPRTSPSSSNSSSSNSSSESLSGEEGDERVFQANSSAVAVGGVAGDVVALLLVTPIAVLCNRQMTAGHGMAAGNAYRPLWATAREVWGLYQQQQQQQKQKQKQKPRPMRLRVADGCRGLYAGLSAGVVELPASAVWWGLYSEAKALLYTRAEPTLSRWERERLAAEAEGGQQQQQQRWRPWEQNWFLSPTDNPALNAMAGVVASGVTAGLFNPIGVVQTRMQALPLEARDRGRGGWPFARVRHIAVDLVRREGWRGFYKGTVANMGAAVLDGVVFSLMYEFTKLGSDRQFLEKL